MNAPDTTASDAGTPDKAAESPRPAPQTPAAPSRDVGGAAQAATRRSIAAVRLLAILAVLVSVLAVLASVWVWQRSEKVTREAVRRWHDGENRVAQVEQQARAAQDQVRDLIGRQAVLENKLGEAAGQQAQLEKLYKAISQDSLDSVLADAENALSIASQQLLVGANVQGALVALQDAEGSLKRAEPASVAGLRRFIQRDIDALRAVPVTDTASLMLRLDSVMAQLDQLPMLSGVEALVDANGAAAAPVVAPPADTSSLSLERLAESGRRGWEALKNELQALIRVNRVDAPDAVLLAPTQQYFVRENLRLTLQSARLAMLSRNDTVFRSDLQRAINWLNTYYDRNNKAVVNAVASLRQLSENKVSYDLPSLAESLGAVRALRAAREGSR